jgi:gas vesicle protein
MSVLLIGLVVGAAVGAAATFFLIKKIQNKNPL